MTSPTDAQLDSLLESLDRAAQSAGGYPPYGLPIWGDTSKRDALRLVVLTWLVEIQPECGR